MNAEIIWKRQNDFSLSIHIDKIAIKNIDRNKF